jgi:AraC-like DNA-binding protein
MHEQPVDRLSTLLERFRVRTHLSFTGTMCGLHRFDQNDGKGYLHLLRRGNLEVNHPGFRGMPKKLCLSEPTLLFYPRPLTHHFHNPPKDGSDLTCAEVNFDDWKTHPIARALPPYVILPLRKVQGLGQSLDLLFAETGSVRCGQRVLADRLFEVVLIQLLRWMLDHPAEVNMNTGLLVGLSSPQLALALVAVHAAPEQAWSLERLAQSAGMSRTAFAVKFKQLVGQPPAEYLADWRLTIAQARLREGVSLKTLAGELGYSTPSALTRVFTARLGVSPREWLSRRERALGD